MFKNFTRDDGQQALPYLDFGVLNFRCKFKDCQWKLTYEQFINESYHDDCDYRPYKCSKCNQIVPKGMIKDHKINICKS